VQKWLLVEKTRWGPPSKPLYWALSFVNCSVELGMWNIKWSACRYIYFQAEKPRKTAYLGTRWIFKLDLCAGACMRLNKNSNFSQLYEGAQTLSWGYSIEQTIEYMDCRREIRPVVTSDLLTQWEHRQQWVALGRLKLCFHDHCYQSSCDCYTFEKMTIIAMLIFHICIFLIHISCAFCSDSESNLSVQIL
jgi:hypothetical protein